MLEISGDLTTDGGEGTSLVKGVQVSLKAIALSIKPGAEVGTISIGGTVSTAGDDVITVELDGEVGRIEVAGKIKAGGARSDGVHVTGSVPGLHAIAIQTRNGQDIVKTS